MNRLPLEVADLVRVAGPKFVEGSRRWITGRHLKVLTAIERCRTAALGGHRDRCSRCGYRAISFNFCRDRHCPKCQAHARDQWLQARRQAHPLRPCGLHPSSPARPTSFAEQEGHLQPVVPGLRTDLA
jgi:predicted Zn-ribbon and HTH transcriptional regulator